MSQRRVDMFVFSSNRAFLDASFARKLEMIYEWMQTTLHFC